MRPLFSVTIPAYKRKFLAEAIESVLAQTDDDFELIIVNDHSPEDLDSVVKQFSDSRIHYFVNQKNCGAINVVDNWNICLNYASGEYIICMGDDDKLLPCCLSEYRKLISDYPNLAVYHGWTEIIDENSKPILMQEGRPVYESMFSAIYARWKGRLSFIGDYLFHTETLKKDGGFYFLPLAWGSDDLSSFIAASHAGIANTQVPVFQYRINSLTLSSTGNSKIKLQSIKGYKECCQSLLANTKVNDGVSEIFKMMAINELTHTIMKKQILEIKSDMIKNGIFEGIFKWYKLKKEIEISLSIIILSAFEAIKAKAWMHKNKNKNKK